MSKPKVFISDDICKQREDGSYYLYGSVCPKCGHKSYPASGFCTKCLCEEQEEYEIADTGTVYSYTITRTKPPYGNFPKPHPICWVSIPESEARVTAPLFIEEEADYKVGATAKMEFATYWEDEDKIVIGPKYHIVKEDK